jgi:galactitol-specific phosphotransferase system IIB component
MIDRIKKITPVRLKEFYRDILGYSFIRNHFQSDYKRKVLISYINRPFYSKHSFAHTNFHEAVAIADVFDSLEYKVDLIEYTKLRPFLPESYDVIFGLGESVEFALRHRAGNNKNPFVIWHGTGANPFFSNPLTIRRLKNAYDHFGALMFESTRFLDKVYPLSYVFSDLIILYGNEFTKRTYLEHTYSPIETIGPTSYFNHFQLEKKAMAKENYLWFGSAGVIHKGLDLLIDFFEKRPDLSLHICGDVEKEVKFHNAYARHLYKLPNIKYHGFLDVMSNRFRSLMETCAFAILPSCSEGIATSVVTTMANGGLIPIVTRNTGIDHNGCGISIDEISLEGIEQAIIKSQELTLEEIKIRSNQIQEHALENFSIDNFKKKLTNILINHLDK